MNSKRLIKINTLITACHAEVLNGTIREFNATPKQPNNIISLRQFRSRSVWYSNTICWRCTSHAWSVWTAPCGYRGPPTARKLNIILWNHNPRSGLEARKLRGRRGWASPSVHPRPANPPLRFVWEETRRNNYPTRPTVN